MPRETPLVGGCLCGGVRYAIVGSLRHASHCHCAMCRKHHGAAFGSYASSPGIGRGFCTRCGSTLFWDALENRDSFGVALGTFDGDPGVRPSLHIFVGSKAPWYEFSDALPKHPTSPRAEAVEPA